MTGVQTCALPILGVLGYQRPFIKNFAALTQPLTNLLKKDTPFKWTEEHTTALTKLLDIVESDPVLHCPDYARHFELEVDASQYANGAILFQRGYNGQKCVVGYYSKTFNEAERNYDIHDRELLAVIRALRRWRHILLSSKYQVIVHTDHANLLYWRDAHKISRRVARYLPDLGDYNFTLVHQPGTSKDRKSTRLNSSHRSLSRMPSSA